MRKYLPTIRLYEPVAGIFSTGAASPAGSDPALLLILTRIRDAGEPETPVAHFVANNCSYVRRFFESGPEFGK